MLNLNMNLLNCDKELWDCIEKEKKRQEEHIDLIASENYASLSVMQAQGSLLTNKYAEGYPGKRYYAGCEYIDIIEAYAIDRAKKLFNADYANVQPHSGSQANFAVYTALLKPGDKILGMHLAHGGHLTHGASVNLSGQLYNVITYGVNSLGKIDYNKLAELANMHKPKMIIGGFSSYSGICNWEKMREIAQKVKAYLLVDIAHVAGLIAAGIYPNPILYADIVTSTTHKTLAGPRGGLILAKNGSKELYKKLNSAVFPGTQGGPLMHVIAAKAVAFKEAMKPEFKKYQQEVVDNAKTMVQVLIERGYNIVSGATYNHLFVVNLIGKNITGKEAEDALSRANIIVNKNVVPEDTRSALITSGIRIGTAAITRRGFKNKEIYQLSHWIADILNDIRNEQRIKQIQSKIKNICLKFPVYIS